MDKDNQMKSQIILKMVQVNTSILEVSDPIQDVDEETIIPKVKVAVTAEAKFVSDY